MKQKVKIIIAAIYILFCGWLVFSAIDTYRQIPIKNTYRSFQTSVYSQVFAIKTLYMCKKYQTNIRDDYRSKLVSIIDNEERNKALLLNELDLNSAHTNDINQYSHDLYNESDRLFELYKSEFIDCNSDEDIFYQFNMLLKNAQKTSYDCSINRTEVERSITNRSWIDDVIEAI